MLKKRCPSPPCRKLKVTSCQGWKSLPGHSANHATSGVPPDISSRNASTLAMTSACVAGGISGGRAGRKRCSAAVLDVPQHLVSGARHVFLQPVEHRFAVLHGMRRALGGGDH